MKFIFTICKLYNNIKVYSFLLLFLFFFSTIIYSQNNNHKPPDPTAHHEVKDDNYVPVSRSSQGRSPAYSYSMANIFTTQVNVDENGQNILGDAANEPSIAVDPLNHNIITIGWRQFNTVSSNFRQAGYGYTTNGGQTWTFPGVIQPGIFRSDPVLDADAEGNIYYNSLTNNPDFYCKVFKSTNGGFSWDNGTDAQGGDKQWMTIDKTNGNGSGNIYAFWTSFYSVCYPGFFTRSTNNGASFGDCTIIPNDPYWGTLTVGSGGNLYLAGTIGYNFLVARSSNAQDSNQTVTWDQTAIVNLDGTINSGIGPNPGGLLGQTIIGVDTSNSPYHGNVYLLCSVSRNSSSDPADVMFARSTDGGVNWSSPIKINNDLGTSAYQWFGTMSVAPNGRIDVVWLDTRDNPGTYLSALYYSNSKDGGLTWSPNERLSDFFDPHVGWPNQDKMGDYYDMVSDSVGAYLAWAATFNNEQDVYFSFITDTTGNVPVELQAFSASLTAGTVNLKWSTATETNNRGFEIERSADKANWKTIGFKEGKGTTAEPQFYSYSDKVNSLSASKLYYRLKQVDYNGSFKYSNIVEVKIVPEEYILSQNYPNPFNPSTTISYTIPQESFVDLAVYNMLGQKVMTLVNDNEKAGKYDVTFDASKLASGVYLYRLTAGNYVSVKKMILQK